MYLLYSSQTDIKAIVMHHNNKIMSDISDKCCKVYRVRRSIYAGILFKGSWICIAPHCEKLASEVLRHGSHSFRLQSIPHLPLNTQELKHLLEQVDSFGKRKHKQQTDE